MRINPKFSKAINNIGVLLYKEKNYVDSAKKFEITLDVDPQYHEVYSNKGAAYNKAKNYEKAIESLEKAIELIPELEKYFNIDMSMVSFEKKDLPAYFNIKSIY